MSRLEEFEFELYLRTYKWSGGGGPCAKDLEEPYREISPTPSRPSCPLFDEDFYTLIIDRERGIRCQSPDRIEENIKINKESGYISIEN
jgi:hypothetical protein